MQADSCVFTALWQERSFNESRWQIGGRWEIFLSRVEPENSKQIYTSSCDV